MTTIDNTPNRKLSQSISDDIRAFLERGGEVETLPAGAASRPLKAFGHREMSEVAWAGRSRTLRAATSVLPARR